MIGGMMWSLSIRLDPTVRDFHQTALNSFAGHSDVSVDPDNPFPQLTWHGGNLFVTKVKDGDVVRGWVRVGRFRVLALFDTGASRSIISEEYAQHLHEQELQEP